MGHPVSWAQQNWKVIYLVYSITASLAAWFLIRRYYKTQNGGKQAAVIWGVISFGLLIFFFLGAADNTKQFLTFFSFGGLGVALGYLTGVWMSPSSLSEETRLLKAQHLFATLLAGALGTKLLSLWDSLTRNDQSQNPAIFKSDVYLPLLSALVGYFVALAAFYTLRSAQEGLVRITAPTDDLETWNDPSQKTKTRANGLSAGKEIQFAGAAADFSEDLSVLWELRPADRSVSPPV